jgi:transposase InsO family protein
MAALHSRRTYDHRICEAICESGDRELLSDLNIPRSTIRSWIHRGMPDVVATNRNSDCDAEMTAEIERLRRRTAVLGATIGLLLAMLRVSKIQLDNERLPEAEAKKTLLRAIDRAKKTLPLSATLRITRLSASRYHSRSLADAGCKLEDQPSCPRVIPTRLTPAEVDTMRELVEARDCRHMSLRALALHAQRLGKVFASPSTWYRLARARGWVRPRKRLYPPKPKLGIRTGAPGELLHLDVTIIWLLDGTRTYLHGVIDNYSRRILAWRLEERLGSGTTCRILREAAARLCNISGATIVVADSGSENVSGAVDAILDGEELTRVLAQVEVTFSNSMIEAFWRSLKHAWLYLHSLDSFTALQRLIGFYVDQHNRVMPHAAFAGQTPDEIFFGRGDAITEALANGRTAARETRLALNRATDRGACVLETNPGALQVQRPRSRMS